MPSLKMLQGAKTSWLVPLDGLLSADSMASCSMQGLQGDWKLKEMYEDQGEKQLSSCSVLLLESLFGW